MSGHGTDKQPVDVLRKGLIVSVLFVGIVLLYASRGVPSGEFSTGLMAVGFVILASYTIGELAEVAKLPHITGYLLAGLLLGGSVAHTLHDLPFIEPWLFPPFDKGLLNENVLKQLGLMDTLALALICLTAGGELKLESLKSGLWRILGILGAQTVTILTGITGLFLLMSQSWSPLLFDKFAGLDLTQAVAVGAVLASVALATAPAATIAVINSTGSKGPMTSNILPVVVLKDVVVVVAFSATSAIAVGALGTGGGGSFGAAIGIIVASIVFGLLVGLVIDLYLRYVGAEVLLFIVGMIFATAEGATLIAHAIDPAGHPELALVFIAAGFATGNFSSVGDELIHEVERLSLPVYVVFFTMAGAKLHLDDLLASWQFALLLVGTRIAMIWAGVAIGSRVPGTDAMTRKYAWMGFISQAGLALTLAGAIQRTFGGELGSGLFSLILAGVALNEILGPVLLQFGLGFAGETAAQRGEGAHADQAVAERDPTEEVPDRLAPWRRIDAEADAWGPGPATASDVLNETATDLELELRQLVRDLERGPLTQLGNDAQTYLRALRRPFLRFHRHLSTRWSQDRDPSVLPSFLRTETATLADSWRDHLLARAASLTRQTWSPVRLQEAVDASVADLPEVVEAPVESDTLAPRPESLVPRVGRAWLRVQRRFTTIHRTVQVRDLARYHFQGRVAGRMEGLAALTVNAELHLAARTSALFDAIDDAAERIAALARTDPAQLDAAIEGFREEIEQEFRFAVDEVGWVGKDAHTRATHILGSAMKELKEDLLTIDTPDLPARHRRFARVFQDRTRGLNALTEGLEAARHTVSSRYAALALVFEVVGLEAHVKEAVDAHSDRLRRQIRGKGLTQLERVREALVGLVAHADTLLQPSERPGPELAAELKASVEPVARVVEDAAEATTTLRDWLAGEASDEPLLDAILAAAQGLSERYDVPVRPPEAGEWALPAEVPTTEIPFREVAVSFIEAHITRDLIDVTRRLSAQVDGLVASLQELLRVLTFNAELAHQELDVHPGALSDDTRQLVRDIVLGSWGRSLTRLDHTHENATPLPGSIDQLVQDAVLAKLDTFRSQVLDGRITDLRHTLLRQVRVQRRFLNRAGSLSELVSTASEQVTDGLSQTLGDERIAALRYRMGLREAVQGANPEAFAAPVTLARLPTVYRRLFSDHALEAGDLLTGREHEYADALRGLRADGPGLFRSVALVGLDTIGRRALASALIRGLGAGRIVRRSPTGPVSVAAVNSWFEEETGGIVVIEGLHHLFELRPGGFAPLRRFVRGVVEDRGRTAFIVMVDTPVWHFAVRASAL
ncbi:MAG: cation:proton antiporter, partial [Myxococcota bacterium]